MTLLVLLAALTGFELQSISPAIDAGVVIASVIDDFNGVSRPQCQGYDIGAHEFDCGNPPPPPPPPDDPPTVAIQNPANGSTVARRSQVTIRAAFTDDFGVVAVNYLVNGQALPCGGLATSCVWSVPNPPNKNYTITVRARDGTGNIGMDQITVRSTR